MLTERIEERLRQVLGQAEEIERRLQDPEVAADHLAWSRARRQLAAIEEPVRLYRAYRRALEAAGEAEEILGQDEDPEMQELASEQLTAARQEADALAEQLRESLVSEDEDDHRDAIVEIRAGTGGEEAALWAGDLFRMYQRLAERRGWRLELIDAARAEQGGIRQVEFVLHGRRAFGDMRWESGVHRVQRVPKTEAQGRIHTSTATVAVLPDVEDVEIEIKDSDLEVHTMRAGGPGGQNVNKTSSAVRLIHLPTGIMVKCQADPSQHRNRATALRTLRARLYQLEMDRLAAERSADRRSQIGTGERSEKIRTYNFKESRVTDHRVGVTVHALDDVLEGHVDAFTDALRAAQREERLARL